METKVQTFCKKQKADSVRRSMLNNITSVGISTTDEQPVVAEAMTGEGGPDGTRTRDLRRDRAAF